MSKPLKNGQNGWTNEIQIVSVVDVKRAKPAVTWSTWRRMTLNMTSKFNISEAMEVMSDEDLIFIAATNPRLLKNLCIFWSLELQLRKEKFKTQNFEV
jgi:hypothetical protein